MAPVPSKEDAGGSMRARLIDSLSNSYPGSTLASALRSMEECDSDKDPLSSSCFAELRLQKVKVEDLSDDDDELTSLAWLQDSNLLKNVTPGDACSIDSDDDPQKENEYVNNLQNGGYGHQHPPHIPYNPQKHINSKPPYSFSCLIFMAIEDSPDKKLPVKDIYNWILTHFPYFQRAPTGWKNSVRHNLSLNKCFKKVEKQKGCSIGKGSLWMIDPEFRPNLLQALRKTPYHPYHQLQMFNNSSAVVASPRAVLQGTNGVSVTSRLNINTPSPQLFPFLSRRLAQSDSNNTETDIAVANTLVSLKRAADSRRTLTSGKHARSRSPSPPEFGSVREKEMLKLKKLRAERRPVLTQVPSSDHNYSITEDRLDKEESALSPASSIDGAYEFETGEKSDWEEEEFSEGDYDESDMEADESLEPRMKAATMTINGLKQKRMDPEEEAKIALGADALLNLAGITTQKIVPLRTVSPLFHNNNNNNGGKIVIKEEAMDES